MSFKDQGRFFTIYFQVLYVLCFTWPRYKVSVYRTIGPLVNCPSSAGGLTLGPFMILRCSPGEIDLCVGVGLKAEL